MDSLDFFDGKLLHEHRPGDIWSDLPSLGMFRALTVSGLIVTPSCDLKNEKVETFTYLPILPLTDYLAGPAFTSKYKSSLIKLLAHHKQNRSLILGLSDSRISPNLAVLRQCEAEIASDSAIRQPDKQKILALIKILGQLHHSEPNATITQISDAYSKNDLQKLLDDLVKNKRPDVHFLPKDIDPEPFSAVSYHSVVLFRYPISAPLEIFEASNGSDLSWKSDVAEIAMRFPFAEHFSAVRPIKKKRLREAFLKDLLTRFTSLYNRLGSPSLSDEDSAIIREEIKGGF